LQQENVQFSKSDTVSFILT